MDSYFEKNDLTIRKIMSKLGNPRSRKHKKNKFTSDEDDKLLNLVELCGVKTWNLIGKMMGGRTARQCRERYKYYLQPRIMNARWSDVEDDLLVKKYEELGPHWAKIAQSFSCRSNINVRNRYRVLERKNARLNKRKAKTENSSSESESSREEEYTDTELMNSSKIILSIPMPISMMMC